jgi:hypothetical protein
VIAKEDLERILTGDIVKLEEQFEKLRESLRSLASDDRRVEQIRKAKSLEQEI